MREFLKTFIVLTGLVLLPSAVFAQASIGGFVRDTSGAVLPGVTVEASSPALIEKVRSAVTDGAGQFSIVDLRPGAYSVTFSLPGFATVKREGIELTGSFTATLTVEMRVGALEETITVTGESPIVDVSGVTRERVLDQEVISAIPANRSPFALASIIPGVTSSVQDVGGTSTPIGLVNATAHGSRPGATRLTMDGLSTSSALCTGNCGNYLPNTSGIQEMTVVMAAGAAEQALGGVVINVIPQEGGNLFKGSAFSSFANSSMQGDNFTQRLKDAGLLSPSSIKLNYDVNGAFGGPIVRDKIWFYTAARKIGFQNYVAGMFPNLNAGNPDVWTYSPDTSDPAFVDVWQRSINGRITWQITPKNKFAVFYDDQYRCNCPGDRPPGGLTAALALEATRNPHDFPGSNLFTLNWSSPVSSRLLLEAGGMYRGEGQRFGVRPELSDPVLEIIPVTEQSTGITYRAPTIYQYHYGGVAQARGAVSYVTGRHAFKFGAGNTPTWLDADWLLNNDQMSFRFNNGVPNQITQNAQTGITSKTRNPWDLGIYAQDRWTVGRLTANLGVRFDYYTTYFPEQRLGPSLYTPNRNIVFPEADFMSHQDLSPRLGLAYDVFGQGKTALKVTLNKYLASMGLQQSLTGGYNPSALVGASVTRSWNDNFYPAGDPRRGNFVPDCDLVSTGANAECGVMSNVNFGNPTPSARVNPDVTHGWGTRDYNWEFSAGVQHELLPRVSVDVGYFRRWYGGSWSSDGAAGGTVDNLAVSPSDFDPFSIVAPLHPELPGGGGYTIGGLYNLNPSKVGLVDEYLTFPDEYGKRIEHWNGVDVGVNARLQNGVALQGGVSTGRTLTDNCDVQAKIPERDPVGGPYCRVETAFLTQVKLLSSYVVPRIDVQIAATFQSVPGPQLAANYVAPNSAIIPSLGRPLSGGAANVTINLIPPGTMYGERLNQLDLRVAKVLRFGSTRTSLNFDIYNSLNADTVLTQSTNFANWLQPQSVVQPRFAKVSAQIDF